MVLEKETKARVIYNASFASGSGHEAAPSERADAGCKAKEELEKAVLLAQLSTERERSIGLSYLRINAPSAIEFFRSVAD